MSAWPPPPDLVSIKELVRDADVEGFIADGSPLDEYDTEAEQLHAAIAHLLTAEIIAPHLQPILDTIWQESFSLSTADLTQRHTALKTLAQQIARFFGPEAQPQTRQPK